METPFSPTHTLHEEHFEFAEEVENLRRLADSVGLVPTVELRDRLCACYEALTRRVVPHAMAEDGSPLAQVTSSPPADGSRAGPLSGEHAEMAQLLAELEGLRWELARPELTLAQEMALRRVLYGLYAVVRAHLAGARRCACDVREGREESG